MPQYESDPSQFSLDVHCPRCGHLIRALSQTDAVYHISSHMDSQAYLIVRWPRQLCDIFFVIYDRLNRRVQRVYPFPDTSASHFHSAIPESIRKDFAEARRCWFTDAYKGVVIMCRRAMQQIACDKGAKGLSTY
jgi:hypothetical protein